jgi:hypothetical protein
MTTQQSSYKFDGEDRGFLLSELPLSLNSKTVFSEQYDYFDYADPEMEDFDGFDKVWNVLANLIGACMILFSELETQVEVSLYELINDRSHHQGRMITRNMSYRQKIDLYVDYLRSQTTDVYGSLMPEAYSHDVNMIKKHLYRAGELRNIVAHAKWASITKEGYVFSQVEPIGAGSDIPEYKYYKLDKIALENIRAYIGAVGNFPYYITERYVESQA